MDICMACLMFMQLVKWIWMGNWDCTHTFGIIAWQAYVLVYGVFGILLG